MSSSGSKLQTIEDRVKNEWNVIHAFIALHPWVYSAVAFVAGAALGHFAL